MASAPIKVFRHGKGTRTRLEFVEGKPRHTLTQAGAGRFLNDNFQTLEDASNFCFAELQKDESAILYITEGELILKMVLNHAFHEAKKYEAGRRYAVLSSLAFALISWLIVTTMSPFASTGANLALAGGAVLFYILLLCLYGTRNVEAAIVMTLLLVLLCTLLPALKRARDKARKASHSSAIPRLCHRQV